jgi:Skp family chaperone for outer membrane proteins
VLPLRAGGRRAAAGPLALAAAVALSACASTPATVAARPAVAFFDLNAALTQCREGQAAKAELMQTFQRSQAELDRGEQEVSHKLYLIKAKRERGLDVSDEEAAARNDMAALHDQYTKLQSDLSAAELTRADAIKARLRRIARQLATARGIDEVSESALGHDDGRRWVDLTADVVRAADAESGRP